MKQPASLFFFDIHQNLIHPPLSSRHSFGRFEFCCPSRHPKESNDERGEGVSSLRNGSVSESVSVLILPGTMVVVASACFHVSTDSLNFQTEA